MTSSAHDEAVEQLDLALVAQTRAGERYQAALDTQVEFGAFVRLGIASDEVDARQAWLDESDEELDDQGQVWINGRAVGGAGSVFAGRHETT
jgi:hypothetical protein